MRTTKRHQPLASLAIVALTIAGCSSATAQRGAGGSANGTAVIHEMAVKFAECMRDNGVSTFPDPSPSGQLTIDGVANRSSVNTNAPAFKKAFSTCKHLEPPGFTGHKRSAQEQKAALTFAQCVRRHGVSDFPDPSPNAPLVDTNRIPSAATGSGRSILNAAMHACSDMAAAAGVTR